MGMGDLLKKADKYALHSVGWMANKRIVLVEGKGAIVKDADGKEYIDAIAGSAGPVLIGHSHPRFVKAIQRQVELISQHFPIYNNLPYIELAEKLAKITPGNLSKSWICPGGGEANEAAIKVIMRQTGKSGVISLYYAFHGMSLAMINLLGMSWLRQMYPCPGGWPGFQQIPNPYCYRCFFGLEYPDCDLQCAKALEGAIKCGSAGNVGAFILEIAQGPGGQIEFPKEYFGEVRDICDDNEVLIIADEIQTGFGRCGAMFACELYNFQPDVLCVGKALGGGYPMGAAIFSKDLITPELEEKTWTALTFQNQPLACAVASEVIDVVIEEKFPERARKLGSYCKKALNDLQQEHKIIGDVRGPGLFLGVELVKDQATKEPAVEEAQKILYSALDKGLILWVGGLGNVIKIKPPLAITEDQIDRMIEIFDETLREVR